MGKLNKIELESKIKELNKWIIDKNSIVKTYEFSSFPQAIEAIVQVSEVGEAMNHHPDIDIRWRTVVFRCSTHSLGGITEQDIALAKEIDKLLTNK